MKALAALLEIFQKPLYRNILFAFAIALLAFFSFLSFHRIKVMIASSSLVNNSSLVISKIEQTLSIVKDAEIGQRGFIITSDSVFLDPSIDAENRVIKMLAEIHSLVNDNKIQIENLNRFKILINSRIGHLRVSRNYRFSEGYDPDILRLHLLDGKRAMDSVRLQAAKMEDAESILLRERIKRNERNIGATPLFSLIVSLVLVVIIMLSFFILLHRYKEQIHTKEKLKQANLHLKENEEKFRGLLETAPDAMLIVNEQGIITLVNVQTEKLFGYQREKLIGKQISFLIPDRFQPGHLQYQNNYFKQPSVRAMGEGRELFARKSDGTEIPVEISLGPMHTEDGWLVSAAIRDISEKKKTQEVHIESEKLSAISAMSRTIAHEIRNPLTNIYLSVEIIKQKLSTIKDPPNIEGSLDIISRNYTRIDNLVKDLLYSDQAEKRNFKEVDLSEIVEEVLIVAADRIVLKGISLEKELGRDHFILADRESLIIALLNIVINAIEAMMPELGVLKISTVKENDTIMLTIRDNGIGMTKEEVGKMFDPYFTKKPTGLGVGLANVKSILQNHHAKSVVESGRGKGTTFSITFDCYTTSELTEKRINAKTEK